MGQHNTVHGTTLHRARWARNLCVAVAVITMAGCTSSDDEAAVTTPTTEASARTTTVATDVEPEAPTTTLPPPPGAFRVVGSDIVAPDGNIFYPIGANVSVRQGGREHDYTFNFAGTATDRSDAVLAWGWNTVRANIICVSPGRPNQAEIEAGLDGFIDEYTAKNIVVIVECHDLTGKNPKPGDGATEAITGFMERLAAKHATNPYVWYNVFNEPIRNDSVDHWLALQRDALTRIRAVAPDAMFVADIPTFAQGMHTFLSTPSPAQLSDGQCNVVYGWHAWGGIGGNGIFGSKADRSNEQASRANHQAIFEFIAQSGLAFLIGEFGDPLERSEGTAGEPIWNTYATQAVLDMAPQAGIGLLWWHATGDSSLDLTYSLTSDRSAPWDSATSGEGLTTSGRRFWELSQTPRPAVPFSGDYSQSNC